MYGFSVLVAAPSTTRAARTAICAPLGCRKPGGCLTTALATQGLSDKDPAVTIPLESVVDFVAGHRASDHALVTTQYWPIVVDKLVPSGRWSKVSGPLSSAIATLLGFGWQIPKINEIVSPDDVSWGLDYSAPNFMPMLKELLGV